VEELVADGSEHHHSKEHGHWLDPEKPVAKEGPGKDG
jgi:hypothetical protein